MTGKPKEKKIQSRTWGLILPCKWENCMQMVYKAKQVAKYYYWIRHERDCYTEPCDDVDNPHAVGELKDPHIHLLFTFNSSRDLKTVKNYFAEFDQLKENSFEKIANAFGAKRYLTHADNPEKHQYQIEEVETNDRLFPNVFIEKMSKPEMIDVFFNAFDSDAPSMRQYCENFRPMLCEMTSYQMSNSILNYRHEWRFKNLVGYRKK
jgi:hypothetical protein